MLLLMLHMRVLRVLLLPSPAGVAVPATVAVAALVEAVSVGGCAPAASLDGVFGNSAAVVVIAVAAADAGADAVAC